jgi:hypothetical protein
VCSSRHTSEEGGADATRTPELVQGEKRDRSGRYVGLRNKAKVTTKNACGFKKFDVVKVTLYQTLANLPEPKTTRKFCG